MIASGNRPRYEVLQSWPTSHPFPAQATDAASKRNEKFLVLRPTRDDPPVVVLKTTASDDDVLDALLARAYALKDGHGTSVTDDHKAALRLRLRAQGWSTASFMFPDLPVRAHWGDDEAHDP